MKKILFVLISLVALALFSACVKESPEPVFDPSSLSTGERKALAVEEEGGVTYQIFNDKTCEVLSFDGETYSSLTLSIPEKYEGNTVVAIGDGVFAGAKLEEIFLPESLVKIGSGAFQRSSVKKIALPDSLTHLGEECFDSCAHLEEVSFGTGLVRIPVGAFFGCKSLKEIVLPEGVRVIGEEAFADLSALNRISLPSTLEVVGPYAFWNSGSASLILSLPSSVREVGKDAFLNSRIEKILYNGENEAVLAEIEPYL